MTKTDTNILIENEKKMSPQMKYYYKKKAQDPDFAKKEKERIAEYLRNKYANDASYASYKKQKGAEYRAAKKTST